MQKVVSINLSGHAYQLDESGYEALRDYLAHAETQLAANPDRTEILADLEQAIADKCQRYLGPHKSVVTAGEVQQIVAEMGPVDAASAAESEEAGKSPGGATKTNEEPPKRLYRIADGAFIAGVCNGIAAYLHVDVTLVRIVFAVFGLLTKGVGAAAYIALMVIIPEARTPEARAAAAGPPLSAKDVIDRATKAAAQSGRQVRRQWRQRRWQWRYQSGWSSALNGPFVPPVWAALLPIFGLVHLALFLGMAAMMISLVNTGGVLDWQLPADIPLWAAALILLAGYQIVVTPLRTVKHLASLQRPAVTPPWFAFWSAVISLFNLAVVIWVASHHMPEIRDFLHRLPELIRAFADAMRDLAERYRASER
jgi:phage shock protein PspC (stress-responsive transcriptional regulator)